MSATTLQLHWYQKPVMKKIILLSLLSILFIQCNREKSPRQPITGVTGISWRLFSLQKTNDAFINPIPPYWYMQLTDDRSFTFTLHDVTGTGTYSWVQVDSLNAKVTFTIQNWNFPVTDTQYTNRLKEILLSVDSCHYLQHPYLLPIPFYMDPAKMELQFNGNAGYFYVFIL
jgi:hypothetical protein